MDVTSIRRRPWGSAISRRGARRRCAAAGLLALSLLALMPVSSAGAATPANGRAWELITPAEPMSATVRWAKAVAPGGDRLVYETLNPVPGAVTGDFGASNLVTRAASGWRLEQTGASYMVPRFSFSSLGGIQLQAFDEGISTLVLSSFTPLLPGAPADPRVGIYRQAVGGAPVLIADIPFMNRYATSADMTTFVFSSTGHLLPGDAGRASGESIYETTASGLRQVDVDDAGALLSTCGSSLPARSAVSESGELIFFGHPSDPSCGPARVYLRKSGSDTVEASASQCTRIDCSAADDVRFAGATPSGSVVFMTTLQQLTDDDVNAKRDLYRFETATGVLDLVSPGSAAMEGEVAAELVRTSANGSRTYFHGVGKVLPGEGSDGVPGLYLADDAGLHFLGPVETADPIQISGDGSIAIAATSAALGGGDTDAEEDVYRYHAATESWLRLSDGPSGGNGPFKASFPQPDDNNPAAPSRRALTVDGQRIFFHTDEALVPEDRNEARDVYEWVAGGVGLISSGQGTLPAHFEAVSPDGTTAVFLSAATLLPRDRDGGDLDLYAARIGGGFDESEAGPETCGACDAQPGSLNRPGAASAVVRRVSRGRLKLRKPGEGLAREIVKSGRGTLELSVPAPGRVAAEARSSLGGKPKVIARGVAGAIHPGRLRLQLAVSKPAQRALIQDRALTLRLVLRQSPLQLRRTLTLELGGAK